jgi:transposase
VINRPLSSWVGLTPRDHSTAGKVRHGVITRAGDEALRSVLVAGATAVVRHVTTGTSKNAFAPWVEQLLKRKAPKLVAVALANKMARVAWKLMATGECYVGKCTPVIMAIAA